MSSELEKMIAGETYDPNDPELVAARERASELTREYNRTRRGETERRATLLEELFGSVDDAEVFAPIYCDYGFNVHAGDEFFASFDCVFLDVCDIEFGEGCMLGPGVHVYTATHPLDAQKRASGLESGIPVTVGDQVWIGGRSVLTPGVTVGDRSVIGAGSVVVDDVPSDVVVAGNPATVVKELE
jgi:maltose O-acetyltransferase